MIYPGFDKVRHHFQPILERVCFFHGRVSNAESIQIDIGDGEKNDHVNNFTWLWETSMRHWLARTSRAICCHSRRAGTAFIRLFDHLCF